MPKRKQGRWSEEARRIVREYAEAEGEPGRIQYVEYLGDRSVDLAVLEEILVLAAVGLKSPRRPPVEADPNMTDEEKMQFGRDLYDASYAGAAAGNPMMSPLPAPGAAGEALELLDRTSNRIAECEAMLEDEESPEAFALSEASLGIEAALPALRAAIEERDALRDQAEPADLVIEKLTARLSQVERERHEARAGLESQSSRAVTAEALVMSHEGHIEKLSKNILEGLHNEEGLKAEITEKVRANAALRASLAAVSEEKNQALDERNALLGAQEGDIEALAGAKVAAAEARAERAERERAALRSRVESLEPTVAFFASVIKSGEPWTSQCEDALRAAKIEGNQHER